MGSYTNGVYVPDVGETGWGEEVSDFLTRSGEREINVKLAPYGAVGDGVHDDTEAIRAAVAAAAESHTTIFFPGGYYKVTETIDLSNLTLQHWVGGHASGGQPQFAMPPQASIDGRSMADGAGPVVYANGGPSYAAGSHTFENLSFLGNDLGMHVQGAGRFVFDNCNFSGQVSSADRNAAMLIENSFWFTFRDCNWLAPSTAKPSLYLLASDYGTNARGAGIMNMWDCVFAGSGMYYALEESGADYTAPNMYHCLTESSATPLLDVVATEEAFDASWFFGSFEWVNSGHADALVNPLPLLRLDLGSHGSLSSAKLYDCDAPGIHIQMLGNNASYANWFQSGRRGNQGFTINEDVEAHGNWIRVKSIGLDLVGSSTDATDTDIFEFDGASLRLAKGGDRHASVGLEPGTGAGSGLLMGPGGAGGTWDANLYRAAADRLALDGDLEIEGKVGFYGTTPVAKQTGVGVSAAAIHAALVNLGLISA